MKRSLTLLLLICSAAFAEDVEAKYERAIQQIAGDDADERNQGRQALELIVEERPDLVRKAAHHPDLEVAASAARVLFDHPVLRDLVEEKRFGEILEAISNPSRSLQARRELFAKYMTMGAEAVEFLAAELRGARVEPVKWNRTMRPDDLGVIPLTLKNCGTSALWFRPGVQGVIVYNRTEKNFGREEGGRCGRVIGCGPRGKPRTAEEYFLDAISGYRRVPAGSEFVFATLMDGLSHVGQVDFSLCCAAGEGLKATFASVPVEARNYPEGIPSQLTITVLGQQEVEGLGAEIVGPKEGRRPVLRLSPREGNSREEEFQHCFPWWVAVDEHGQFLGTGPLAEPAEVIRQTPGSATADFEMPCDPPPGTRRLYMGLDLRNNREIVVPPPLEIDGEKAPG